jgi:glycosyltransferase involved in cell wall biosynthesis
VASFPRVSVVVPAYNEARHLERCLSSLQRQSLPLYEIVVVDDGSSDETAVIAARHPIHLIQTAHRGPAHARNAGARATRGDILVFVDADIECATAYVERLIAPIVEGRAAGTFSKETFIGNASNPWARAYARIRRLAFPRLLPESHPEESANFRAILRDRFVQIGGYDEVGYGEDMTLAPKLGHLAIASPGAVCWHYNPDTLGEIFENARWIGRGKDIGELRNPWLSNSAPVALYRAAVDILQGGEARIIPARLAYSIGIWVGLVHRALHPHRHWK